MHWTPSITNFALIRSKAPTVLRRFRDATAPVPWPNLHTLTIETETVYDAVMSEVGDLAPPGINAENEFTKLICGVMIARELARAPITGLNLDSGIPDMRKEWLRSARAL